MPVKISVILSFFLGPPDLQSVRIFSLIGLGISLALLPAAAQSNPSWWNLASPEATALVGMQWENLRRSPFADALGAELSSSGSLGFPDLPCLADAKQILISSPALLAIAAGSFPAAAVRAQAASKGLKPASYRGIDLWISPGRDALSVAQWSDGLLLIGLRKTLEAAIDRNLPEGDSSEQGRTAGLKKLYSPLLSRAARIAGGRDLWVVANQFPDPLASLFVPLDAEGRSFEGAASVRYGLDLQGTLDAGSPQAAAEIAQTLERSIPTLPAVARGLQVKVSADTVMFSLDVGREQLTASLRQVDTPPTPEPALAAASKPPKAGEPSTPSELSKTAEPVNSNEIPKPGEPVKPSEPQIIRIYGLDDGPREIVLPPAGER
jgi:hypothetical protein